MPDFKSEAERRQWIIDHADHFTIVRKRGRENLRAEVPDLATATQAANSIIEAHPDARLMIYAVYGTHDTWVQNFIGGQKNG